MGVFDQSDWPVRFEWGLAAVETLAPTSDVVVIVDVLRFTTTVTAATERDAVVYPYRWKDSTVDQFASSVDAFVAGKASISDGRTYSLSPKTMAAIPRQTRLVLPSPNGSALSFAAQSLCKVVLAGSLRNAAAVALVAETLGEHISVVASGERWKRSDDLRPAIEDLIGAGAVIAHLKGNKSPEATVAERTFLAHQDELLSTLRNCASGLELIEMGYEDDVEFAALLNESTAVPILQDTAFVRWNPSETGL